MCIKIYFHLLVKIQSKKHFQWSGGICVYFLYELVETSIFILFQVNFCQQSALRQVFIVVLQDSWTGKTARKNRALQTTNSEQNVWGVLPCVAVPVTSCCQHCRACSNAVLWTWRLVIFLQSQKGYCIVALWANHTVGFNQGKSNWCFWECGFLLMNQSLSLLCRLIN